MKGGESRTTRSQFLNLVENRFPDVVICRTAGDNHHQHDRHGCDEQTDAQNPELPSSVCSSLAHGRLPRVPPEVASNGSSSMRRRGFVSWNQDAVRSLTPCSINNSRI